MRLLHLLLFGSWLVGLLTAGPTLHPVSPDRPTRTPILSVGEILHFRIEGSRGVLTVGSSPSRWDVAAPLPSWLSGNGPMVGHWGQPRGERPRTPHNIQCKKKDIVRKSEIFTEAFSRPEAISAHPIFNPCSTDVRIKETES
jgi:hypothetical protein